MTSMTRSPETSVHIPEITINGMPTFEEQEKQKSLQRAKVEAKLAAADDSGSSDDQKSPVIGPSYLQALGEALATTMQTNNEVTDFLKVQEFYANLKEGIYKALSSLSSYQSFKQFLQADQFYSSADSDPCADVRDFMAMCLSEISRFENSQGYKDANSTQKNSMCQNELSVLENYANALNNSSMQETTFVNKVKSDQSGEISSFAGIGDFLENVSEGYAEDLN